MSAIISDCKNYRYRLEREVDPITRDGKVIAYIGVNPSTADAQVNDATVRKWIGFTRLHGGRKLIVGNVFAWRATNVRELIRQRDPIGPLNWAHLTSICADADIIVPCWGSRTKLSPALQPQLDTTMAFLHTMNRDIMVFGHTSTGDPAHPLMLGYDTQLKPYTPDIKF